MHLNVKRDSCAGRWRLQVLLLRSGGFGLQEIDLAQACCLTSSNLGEGGGGVSSATSESRYLPWKHAEALHEEVLHPFEVEHTLWGQCHMLLTSHSKAGHFLFVASKLKMFVCFLSWDLEQLHCTFLCLVWFSSMFGVWIFKQLNDELVNSYGNM